MKRLAVSAFLCFAVTSQLHAEPGPIGRYLMSKEVSLFSFGLFQLDLFIKELETEHAAGFWAGYVWDKNRIRLWALSVERQVAPTKDDCTELMRAIREHGLVNPNSGKLYLDEGSRYSGFFQPIGYVLKDEPENLRQKLEQIFEVHVRIHDKSGNNIYCKGPLLSNKVFIETE